jgi:hypothetical protein
VMRAFLGHCDGRQAARDRPARPKPQEQLAEELSNMISTVECEEAAADA